MKKIITGLISLLLAGSMAFGLAACNNETDKNGNTPEGNTPEGNTPDGDDGDDGEISLADAIEATYALDNFTLTETEKIGGEIKYDGQAMDPAAATVYGTVDMGDGTPNSITFSVLLPLVTGDDDLTITENPFIAEEETFEYKYDYLNGKISDNTYSYWDNIADKAVDYIQYYEADGAEIKIYNQNMNYEDSEVYNTLKVYSGYGTAATAKAALKEQVPPELAYYLNSTFGMGKPGSDDFKVGKFADFIDDFTLGTDGKTFSAPLLPEDFFEDEPQPIEYLPALTLVVENGKISSVDMQVSMTMNLTDILSSMVGGESDSSAPEPAINWADEGEHEIIINRIQSYTYVISAVGSTTVDIPAERKNVTGEHTETAKVITDFQSAVSPVSSTDGTVSFYYSKNESGENFYLNTALGLLLHRHSESGELKYAKLYSVSGTELKTYEATIENGQNILSWGTPTTTAVSGDVISEFKKLLPEEGKMCFSIAENYDKIKTYNFNSYSVVIDGKEVSLYFDDYDSDGAAHLRYYNYEINEGDSSNTIGVYIGHNENITAMELPESVGNEPVDAAEWSELTGGWNSFNSLTVQQGNEKTYIVKDNSGTVSIAVVGELDNNYFGLIKYATYTPKSGEEGQYDMVLYSYEQYGDSYSWKKTEYVVGDVGENIDSVYGLTKYLTQNEFQFSDENKTLAEMTAKYDNLIKAYRITDESADYVLRFNDDGSLEFGVMSNYGSISYVKFTDKDETVLPQLPQEAQDAKNATITITVKYPDGIPVNGHTDGTKWDNDTETETNVWIQLGIAPGQGFEGYNVPATLGTDGTIKLNIPEVLEVFASFEGFTADTELEILILGLDGYKTDGYGTFTQNNFPSNLDITLVAI